MGDGFTLGYSEIDDQISELGKRATQLKDVDWDGAISHLRRINALLRRSKVVYPIATWLRLPLFLQQAGRFPEAIQEFNRLIKETPKRVKNQSLSDASATWLEYRMHVDLKYIYDKMRLVHKREKRYSEAAQYADMSEEHDKRANELWEVLETEREQDRLAYEAKSAERRERSRLG
jgi:tetratricopeptide (TPR) repeat protein